MNSNEWLVSLLLLTAACIVPLTFSCSNKVEVERELAVAVNEIMEMFVEVHPADEPCTQETLDEAYSIAETITDSEYIDGDTLVKFSNTYSSISTEYIRSIFEEWQESCDMEEIAPGNIAGALQEAVGFDYNNELTNYQLTHLDFDRLEDSFYEAAGPIQDVVDNYWNDLEPIQQLANRHPISDELLAQITEANEPIRDANNKLDGVFDRIFNDLRDQAADVMNEARLSALDRRFNENYEEGMHITWYKHVNNPRYVNSRSWAIYPYIGCRDSGHTWMNLTLGFHRSDWIFIEHGGFIKVVIDGRDHQVNYDSYSDVDTHVGGGISEWVDLSGEESLIRDIAGGERVVVVFSGNQGTRRIEHALTSSEMTAFRETVEFYELLAWNRSR